MLFNSHSVFLGLLKEDARSTCEQEESRSLKLRRLYECIISTIIGLLHLKSR